MVLIYSKLILFLVKNNRIHAFISSQHAEMLREQPKEGTVYIVANFKVKQYVGHEIYHPVRFDKLTEHTRCDKDEVGSLPIKPHAFDFFFFCFGRSREECWWQSVPYQFTEICFEHLNVITSIC